ncbi:MAG: glycoside hydrolase domain-containing protein [Limisphaerales bacterium]
MFTLIRPDVVNDTVNSLIEQADLSGNHFLARWEILTAESGCMTGDPAVSVFAEAYLAGIRNYDVARAYALCTNTVNSFGNRDGRADYDKLGFVPRSLTMTLENAYYDYCAGRFAATLGGTNAAAKLFARSKKLSQCLRSVRRQHAREKCRWFVDRLAWCHRRRPRLRRKQSVSTRLVRAARCAGLDEFDGHKLFLSYLTEFFEKTPASFKWNAYCNQANEPVHHTAYLFTYAGKPWLTQKWSRFITDHAYGPGLTGLCGNEDVGQMSAWYILSAIGFHPVSPVTIFHHRQPVVQKSDDPARSEIIRAKPFPSSPIIIPRRTFISNPPS